MKSYCIVPVLIALLLMLAYECSGQDYVVTTRNDTIRGEVKPLSYGSEKKVQITTADKKKTVLGVTQTFGYFHHGEIFHPVRTEKGYVFMKLIKPGYLSLYGFQLENQVSYDGRYLVKKDGARLEIPNLTFRKAITRFLQECETVVVKIEQGELGRSTIDKIVDEYNDCIERRTNETSKVIAVHAEQTKKSAPWDVLEEKVKAEPDFEGKKDALDMVGEIKKKIKQSEKVPNFLIEGLKSALADRNLQSELDAALNELK
jgi:hypothetical protein